MIWVFALGAGWERFKWLQLFGFAVLVSGTSCYNGLLPLPEFVTGARGRERRLAWTCSCARASAGGHCVC